MKRVIDRAVLLTVVLMVIMLISACGFATEEVRNVAAEASDEKEEDTTLEITDTSSEQEEAPDTATEEESLDIIPESFACALRITINPQVLLYLNQDYSIIGICYENKDAVDAYAEAELFGKSLDEAVDLIMEDDQHTACPSCEGTGYVE